ncbi:N-alpha-acetyltransferase, non-catalitic subunit [Clarireedia jacksonii]
MQGNGVAAISQQVSGLDIKEGPSDPAAMLAAFDSEPPPAPKLHSKGVIATDITDVFTKAAQQLDVGELVKDPFFTLFEAVGALEIMDPKMDSGFLAPGETMEDDYDYSHVLLPEEVIGIIDQLLCHEMAWHMGHPLSQTIFTSLHIDRILSPSPMTLEETIFDRSESCSSKEPLTSQVLRAYCLGLIKTCWHVNNREEDFVTHTYNRSLLESINDDQILHFFEVTKELLTQPDALPQDLKDALIDRLDFREAFLRTVDAADARPPNSKLLWQKMHSFLPNLRLTSQLGKPTPDAFSVKIQRKLASTVPPRPIVHISQDAVYSHLERMCKDGETVVGVLDYSDSHSLMTFVSLFQARSPQPSVYIRTLLQHYIFADMIILGKMSIREVLDGDFASLTLPADKLLDRSNDEIEVPHDPRHNMAKRMELFRSRAANSYLDILRTMCQNRCRIRRTLCHNIVDWDNLQLDGEEIDQELREFTGEEPITNSKISDDPIYAFPLSSWAYFYKLRQMEWIVQMGFELQIYQPDELSGMYWYLNYICKTRSRHLERIRGFVMRSYSVSRTSSKRSTEKQREFANSISYINFAMLEVTATYGFADALSSLFEALRRLSLITTPSRPYSNAIMRYEVRMKPFATIGLPELIPYDEFTRLVTQPDESILDILNFAADATAGAKKGLEILSKLSASEAYCRGSHESWVKDIKDCLKACIFTGITIAAVKKAVAAGEKGDLKIKVELPAAGKGYHDWWIVPKVVPLP